MSKIKRISLIGLLVALEVVLSRFFSIPTPIMKIGLSFLPIALIALRFGPLCAGAAGAAADLLGANLFPIGPYFPGFTLSAFLTGVVFGLLLYRKPRKLWRAVAAAVIIGLFITIGLGTLWLSMLWDKGYIAILPSRITQAAVMVPVQTLLIFTVAYRLDAWLGRDT